MESRLFCGIWFEETRVLSASWAKVESQENRKTNGKAVLHPKFILVGFGSEQTKMAFFSEKLKLSF